MVHHIYIAFVNILSSTISHPSHVLCKEHQICMRTNCKVRTLQMEDEGDGVAALYHIDTDGTKGELEIG